MNQQWMQNIQNFNAILTGRAKTPNVAPHSGRIVLHTFLFSYFALCVNFCTALWFPPTLQEHVC